MERTRRKFVGFGLVAWTTPVITAVSLPTHAQTSVCDDVDEVVMPPTLLSPITRSDNGGLSPITPIDVNPISQCRLDGFDCTGFQASGLPAGLSISSDGIISGTYNANGQEFFTVIIDAVYCGQLRRLGFIDLTITDDG